MSDLVIASVLARFSVREKASIISIFSFSLLLVTYFYGYYSAHQNCTNELVFGIRESTILAAAAGTRREQPSRGSLVLIYKLACL